MMWLVLVPWLWHIFMALVVSVSRSLTLEVLFVVVDQMVLVSGGFRMGNLRSVLSEELVNNVIFLPGIDVHISNWRQDFLVDFGACGSAPVGLNCLHVPLIDHCHDVILVDVVNVTENSLSSPVHQNILLLWCDLVKHAHQKVNSASVAWLSKCLTSSCVKSVHPVLVIVSPCRLDLCEVSQSP